MKPLDTTFRNCPRATYRHVLQIAQIHFTIGANTFSTFDKYILPLCHSTPHSLVVLRQHTDTPWSCPTYPQTAAPSHLLSCHIYPPSSFLSFSTHLCYSSLPTFVSQAGIFWSKSFCQNVRASLPEQFAMRDFERQLLSRIMQLSLHIQISYVEFQTSID